MKVPEKKKLEEKVQIFMKRHICFHDGKLRNNKNTGTVLYNAEM